MLLKVTNGGGAAYGILNRFRPNSEWVGICLAVRGNNWPGSRSTQAPHVTKFRYQIQVSEDLIAHFRSLPKSFTFIHTIFPVCQVNK